MKCLIFVQVVSRPGDWVPLVGGLGAWTGPAGEMDSRPNFLILKEKVKFNIKLEICKFAQYFNYSVQLCATQQSNVGKQNLSSLLSVG